MDRNGSGQLSFEWRPIRRVNRARGMSLADQFEAFDRQNPHVYEALRRLALELRHRGVRQWGMAGLFEVLRWQTRMATDDPASEFRLNNNYRAFYARKLMANEPELAGFFELRVQRWREHEV